MARTCHHHHQSRAAVQRQRFPHTDDVPPDEPSQPVHERRNETTCAVTYSNGDASLALPLNIQVFTVFGWKFGDIYVPNGQIIQVVLR